MLATLNQGFASSARTQDDSIEVDDNEQGFVRDVDCTSLAEEYGWNNAVCRFLLGRHSLRDIRAFAKPSQSALRRGLWLYALEESDFAKSRLVKKHDQRTHMNLYWYKQATKEIYKIGDQYYALFEKTELTLVSEQGKKLHDVTVRATPKLNKILDPDVEYTDVGGDDDDEDEDEDDDSGYARDDRDYNDGEDSDGEVVQVKRARKPLTEEQKARKRERDRVRRQRLKAEREAKQQSKKASKSRSSRDSRSRRPAPQVIAINDDDDDENSVDEEEGDDNDGNYEEEEEDAGAATGDEDSTSNAIAVLPTLAKMVVDEPKTALAVRPVAEKRANEDTTLALYDERANKKPCLATAPSQEMVLYQNRTAELESERRLCLVEHERDLLHVKMAQLEMEKRLAIVETEKRASDERAQLLLTVQAKELGVRDKEIALLREKEAYLVEKCDYLGQQRRTGEPIVAIGGGIVHHNNNNAPMQQQQQQRQQQQQDPMNAPHTTLNLGGDGSNELSAATPGELEPLQPVTHPYRSLIHARLIAVQRDNRFNLSIDSSDAYELRDVLFKLLTANQHAAATATGGTSAPLSREDEEMLRSPLLDNNLIILLANNDASLPDQARMDQIFDRHSHANRTNHANMLLQLAFLRKAREFGALHVVSQKTGQPDVKHRIEVADELRFDYGADCAQLFFPRFSSGLATIVSPSMRFYAQSLKTGPGDGKCCPFCCKNYANYSAGNIKYMHQLPGCDVLANLGQNERVVLEKILAHREASVQFATHPMVSPYSEQSILRRATPLEVQAGNYVRCKLTKDRVRLNMDVYMKLRYDTTEEFLSRLRAFATSKKELFNLNAKPLPYLLDVLGMSGPVRQQHQHRHHHHNNNNHNGAPKKKELVAPKRKLENMSEAERMEKNQRDATLRCRASFMGRVLINHQGENYLDNLPVRDFCVGADGFADGMYFESTSDQETRERRERVCGANESHPANALLAKPVPALMDALVAMQQQQQQQPQPNYFPFDFQFPMPGAFAMPPMNVIDNNHFFAPMQQEQPQQQHQHQESNLVYDAPLTFTTTTTATATTAANDANLFTQYTSNLFDGQCEQEQQHHHHHHDDEDDDDPTNPFGRHAMATDAFNQSMQQ